MTVSANKIPSVIAMSKANIRFKSNLRHLMRDCTPELIKCLDGLGSDPIICKKNKDLKKLIQHVDLTQYYEYIGEINCLLGQAYNIAGKMHNEQTKQGKDAGIVMDLRNGGGTDR